MNNYLTSAENEITIVFIIKLLFDLIDLIHTIGLILRCEIYS